MKKQIYAIEQDLLPAFTPGTTGNGLVLDTQNFRTCMVNLAVATVTSGSAKLTLQHGDEANGSDMANYQPDGSDIETETLTATNTNTELVVDLTGTKRYIRFVSTTTGTVSDLAAFALMGDAHQSSTWDNNVQGVER